MTASEELARVITLLDEAKEELRSGVSPLPVNVRTRVDAKITEAQNILVGSEPTRPEDN